ncbi:peptidyl-prolyl cis-trans isomerase [Pseudohalocynthiibacter aestuariivivens]|jgi:peptidyl-prolyl cis-trans isomerase D|uniref:Peptidyl-prolyl cis-trans isomerase n=1 Tax=Pseudohalocynthiibacter aestuariivivens TaxID=1591409 RepID=A0ABV5JFP2_9RHOB|nr:MULTISPECIES: peptidyl-prolyl cis-trans isomerase [Pseudohalocynthiibacter]MBS9716402.1 SurA N-terminal domain-containing protein [Pseudohalocynthiibacter aestuariivivens]MCK0100789.1 SurA N-terminal domain-containing protein [Pseudohalocynthiibacter sp. F2068]
MTGGKTGSVSKLFVWIILLLLIVGLGGFGVSNFGGSVRSIGAVGDKEISVDDYARALQQELRAFQAQTGQTLPLQQARVFGLDQNVIQRLIATAALDNETARIGLSVGDEQVRRQLLDIAAFQGIDGQFDRDAYRFALQQSNLNEREYETRIREETARTLLQGAVIGGVEPSETFANSILNYVAERRTFTWIRLDESSLVSPLQEPSEEDLTTYYQANTADFTEPEKKRISYVWIAPDMILDTIEIDDEALRALYDSRIEEFVIPERRLIERLVFANQSDADAADQRLNSGEISFDDLVAERGLSLTDIDLGDVTKSELGAAGETLFELTEPGVTNPLSSSLGPAIFRMNGILPAQETTFEEARRSLVDEFALDRARRIIADGATNIDDLLAGGASLEEIAEETEMRLEKIDWWDGLGERIASYNSFRDAARDVNDGDFPELLELEDGGYFALRLDDLIDPTLSPIDEVRDKVVSGWENQQTEARLLELAEQLSGQIAEGVLPESLGLSGTLASDLTRDGFIEGAPDSFVTDVFGMAKGDVTIIEGFGAVYIVRLDSIDPPDQTSPDTESLQANLDQQIVQSVSQDIFEAYARALQNSAGLSLNQTAITAVNAQFP